MKMHEEISCAAGLSNDARCSVVLRCCEERNFAKKKKREAKTDRIRLPVFHYRVEKLGFACQRDSTKEKGRESQEDLNRSNFTKENQILDIFVLTF